MTGSTFSVDIAEGETKRIRWMFADIYVRLDTAHPKRRSILVDGSRDCAHTTAIDWPAFGHRDLRGRVAFLRAFRGTRPHSAYHDKRIPYSNQYLNRPRRTTAVFPKHIPRRRSILSIKAGVARGSPGLLTVAFVSVARCHSTHPWERSSFGLAWETNPKVSCAIRVSP